jgi:hypothetical protein
MTICTPIPELLRAAWRYETDKRWAQATAAYQEILDNMAHPTSKDVAADRALIEAMRQQCEWRSRETVSHVATTATEAAKWAFDRQGERRAAKRAQAIAGR